jgi:hypothetical protein
MGCSHPRPVVPTGAGGWGTGQWWAGYARHRGVRWVTSVPAMAGVEGVWCTALAVVTPPLDLPAAAGCGGGTPPAAAAAGRGGAAHLPGAQHYPPHGFWVMAAHTTAV